MTMKDLLNDITGLKHTEKGEAVSEAAADIMSYTSPGKPSEKKGRTIEDIKSPYLDKGLIEERLVENYNKVKGMKMDPRFVAEIDTEFEKESEYNYRDYKEDEREKGEYKYNDQDFETAKPKRLADKKAYDKLSAQYDKWSNIKDKEEQEKIANSYNQKHNTSLSFGEVLGRLKDKRDSLAEKPKQTHNKNIARPQSEMES